MAVFLRPKGGMVTHAAIKLCPFIFHAAQAFAAKFAMHDEVLAVASRPRMMRERTESEMVGKKKKKKREVFEM